MSYRRHRHHAYIPSKGFVPRTGSTPWSQGYNNGNLYGRPFVFNNRPTPRDWNGRHIYEKWNIPSSKNYYGSAGQSRVQTTSRPNTTRGLQPSPYRVRPARKTPVTTDMDYWYPLPGVDYRRAKDWHKLLPSRLPQLSIGRKYVQPRSAGSTYSNLYKKMRKYRRPRYFRSVWKGLPRYLYEGISSFRIETGVGTQNFYTITTPTVDAMNIMCSTIANLSSNTSKLLIEKSTATYSMTNNSNANMFLEIWDGYYTRSTGVPPSTLFTNGLLDEGMTGTPSTTWGMDPLKSTSFCQFIHITDVTRVELAEGRGHQHKVTTYFDAVWNKENYNLNSTITYMDNWTRITMFIIRGGAVNDKNTQSLVSTAKVALDCVAALKYNFSYVSPNNEVSYLSNTLPTVTTPTVINESSGTAETNVVV